MESVDCWPMAIIIHQIFGGKPKLVSAFGRDRPLVSSSREAYVIHCEVASRWISRMTDCLLGNSVGAIGSPYRNLS